MNKNQDFYNSGRLVRFMLRRERIISLIWILSMVIFSAALAPAMSEMFDDTARQQFAAVYDNPVMVAMLGPIYGADNYTAGAMYGGMMLLWYAITAAVMNVFLMIRHTRADEEQGRAEVVRSLPVGRLANLHAAMLTAVVINAILAVATGLGLFAMQVGGMDSFGECMLYGAVSGAVGLVFAAFTAIYCQLSSNTSGAMGLSFLTLGVTYMMRAAGDMNSEILSILSPLGMAQRSKIFVENSTIALFGLLSMAAVLFIVAYELNSLRDLGQGFIAARPGRGTAAKSLLSPLGLSWRLLRNTVIVWAIVMFATGGSYGSVIGDIPGFVGQSPEYLTLMGISEEMLVGVSNAEKAEIIIDGFGMFVTGMMSLIALIPVLMAVLKLRSEEVNGRLEHILTRSVSRVKYFSGFIVISFALSVVMQLATVFGLYFCTGAVMGSDNPFVLTSLMKASLVYLPAFWIIIGLAVLLVGLCPKVTGAAWGYYGFVCLATLMGGMGVLPEWLTKLSPIGYVPEIRVTGFGVFPSDDVNVPAMLVMTVIAAGLTAAGLYFYQKRDLAN